ncbi:glycoside hydrolase superfamily [Mariannaea sp. PMI_226]|nr:glycoside hydrolase superfamily [Mariannaea sp. PMI_226]
MTPRESSRPSRGHRHQDRERGHSSRKSGHRRKQSSQGGHRPVSGSEDSRAERSSKSLSAGALNELNRKNERQRQRAERAARLEERAQRAERAERGGQPRRPRKPDRIDYREYEEVDRPRNKKRRVVSGALAEEGRVSGMRGGINRWSDDSLGEKDYYQAQKPKKSKKKLWIILGCSIVLLIIIITVVAVVVSKNKKKDGGSSNSDSGDDSSLDGEKHKDIPIKWQNTYLDPWTWKSTTDFNTTFTNETVGGLPIMGLYSDWDDSARANDNVPPLNKGWGSYADRPARGVCIGGWLYLEPFITPSLFNYNTHLGVVDEYTLMQHLGSDGPDTLENHYASFITEDDFKSIAAAGLDHVRIGFSYWAVQTYDTDPYLFRTSWRYLLRGIEWARKYGLRVNLDLHGLPGSQNGWNHSGRWGTIGWLNGTDGATNAQRALDIHDRLSKFFAQDRYKHVISHYGLANEPRMTFLDTNAVINWTETAYSKVKANGIKALVVFGDGFMGLDNWQGKMTGHDDLVLDVHQYVVFNENQIDYTHKEKISYACDGWTDQTEQSLDTSTGYGPTIIAEWSQADTDCAKFLTGVGWGNRWEGTYDTGQSNTSVLTPRCPTKNSQCVCDKANAAPSDWGSDYKAFLLTFAEAQMYSFEKGWGWWYWTWKTEEAYQWSYQTGLKAGVLPDKAYNRKFNCSEADIPDFSKLSEGY